jgi:hypothetical protein
MPLFKVTFVWKSVELLPPVLMQLIMKVAQKVMPHIFFSFQNKDSNVKIER